VIIEPLRVTAPSWINALPEYVFAPVSESVPDPYF
jgi:hypothetical protein